MSSSALAPPWPYPFWIAHRGAGTFAPENTLAAFRTGAEHGCRMFECDAKLSRDGVLYLLHDSQLERTTSGHGPAGACDWAQLSQLDAGSWLSPRWAGEPLPTLANVLRWCVANRVALNIEIKPVPGAEADTGAAVAELVTQVWPATLQPPVLSSFQPAALAATRTSSNALPRALLLDTWKMPHQPLETAAALGCVALVCHHPLWNAERVAASHAAGLRALSYTVNDMASAERLIALGTDGIITDRIDRVRR